MRFSPVHQVTDSVPLMSTQLRGGCHVIGEWAFGAFFRLSYWQWNWFIWRRTRNNWSADPFHLPLQCHHQVIQARSATTGYIIILTRQFNPDTWSSAMYMTVWKIEWTIHAFLSGDINLYSLLLTTSPWKRNSSSLFPGELVLFWGINTRTHSA